MRHIISITACLFFKIKRGVVNYPFQLSPVSSPVTRTKYRKSFVIFYDCPKTFANNLHVTWTKTRWMMCQPRHRQSHIVPEKWKNILHTIIKYAVIHTLGETDRCHQLDSRKLPPPFDVTKVTFNIPLYVDSWADTKICTWLITFHVGSKYFGRCFTIKSNQKQRYPRNRSWVYRHYLKNTDSGFVN